MARNIPKRIASSNDAPDSIIGGEMATLGHLFDESTTKRQSTHSEDSIPTAESSWHNWDYGSDSCLFDG